MLLDLILGNILYHCCQSCPESQSAKQKLKLDTYGRIWSTLCVVQAVIRVVMVSVCSSWSPYFGLVLLQVSDTAETFLTRRKHG